MFSSRTVESKTLKQNQLHALVRVLPILDQSFIHKMNVKNFIII